jgi:predicted dehydrogenase
MGKLKIGFVGAGFMGQLAHIANYALLHDVEMVALAEGRTKTAEAVARRYGIARVYPDHRAMLDDAQLDAVVAVIWFDLHHAVVPDILERGLHCLTEKPICVRVETAKRLAALANKAGVTYHIGYMKRCDPASVLAKSRIAEWKASGEYGKLRYLRVSMPPGDWTAGIEPPISCDEPAMTYEGVTPEPGPTWMAQETLATYVSFVNYYIHQVNLIRYLLGEDYTVRYAEPSGVVLTAESASGVPIVLEMAAYEVQNEWHEFYTACFERGKVELSLPAPMARQRAGEVRFYKAGAQAGAYERPVLPPRWSMAEQARIFVETIREGKPCISPAEDAVKDLEIAEQYVRFLHEARSSCT